MTGAQPATGARGVAAVRRERAGRRGWWAPLGIYAVLLGLHAPLLRLPYYWDEAGYFIFAALDFFHHGWLVPRSTLANGHPPLLSAYLAAAWCVGGFHPWVTRAAMLAWAAALVWGVYRLAEPRLGRRGAAAPALWAALAPLCFAQATLAQLDLPVAALVIWALVWRARGWRWTGAAVLAAACLMKETAVIAAVALIVVDAAERRRSISWRIAPMLAPIGVVIAWYGLYHHLTGYWLGNPQYFAYNVRQAMSAPRIGLSLLRRLWQLAGYNGTWALTVLAAVAWWRGRRRPQRPIPAAELAVVGAYLGFHSLVGGAVLARYLLPALALYFVWLGGEIVRLPRAAWWVGGCAAFLVINWFWNPPYPFPYEDNLAYVHFVKLQQVAARQLEAMPLTSPLSGPVWTAWPATDELTRPELGYVTRPIAVRAVQDFSWGSLDSVAGARPAALLIYSREYQPERDWAAAVPLWARWAERYFGDAPQAPANAWMGRWGLKPEFERRAGGQWVLLAGSAGPHHATLQEDRAPADREP